ncbi:DUF4091 domain-containing protein [Candidatus Babeliales bacterium]|nr:DUF4091 domain-containing protein [Candidatus Babeliales bacterium]
MNLIILKHTFFCFFLLLCFAISASAGESVKITVYEMSPEPNYHLCTDKKDVEQLTDSEIERYPIWVRRGCVGWNQRGAVAISLQVEKSMVENLSGTLRIHTAKGIYAGVSPPARVDVYTKKSDGNFFHASGKTINVDSMADRASHWIALDVECVTPIMLIILRPNGSYLFLDEIQWEVGTTTSTAQSHPLVGDLQDCQKDGMERYRKSLLGQERPSSAIMQGWRNAFGEKEITVWVERNPFADIKAWPSAEFVCDSPDQVQIFGTTSEQESACLGVLNSGTADENIKLILEGDQEITAHISLEQVDRIMAADGTTVYDPILPLIKDSKVSVPPLQAAYIWLKADLRRMPQGEHRIRVVIRNQSQKVLAAIPGTINVVAKELSHTRRPAAINWAYTNNKPIWSHPDKCLVDLIAHGINVFVIHPANIPMPGVDGKWDVSKSKRLASDLNLYRGKGMLLLFLGWGNKKGPSWLDPLNEASIQNQKVILQAWVHRLTSFIESYGLTKNEWALYPVDEPRGDDLLYLRKLAKWIKEVDPQIQLYANPTSSSKCRTMARDLVPLAQWIDFWQPQYRCASNSASVFFECLSKAWWMYAIPPSPAKTASPWKHYRLLAWRAWAVGAKGIGFWSYCDTSGTTAWNDFDGRRPDWAVVYEGNDGPISSRRWEAFREGIEDFQLLESVVNGDLPSSNRLAGILRSRVKTLLSRPEISLSEVNALRREMLGAN